MAQISSVVVLDNLSSVRTRIKSVLAKKNINVLESSNSIEFFNLMAGIDYKTDLIMIEVELNGEDGFAVLKKLRQKDVQIPIIILTSKNKREMFIKGIIEGAADYILKPFEDSVIESKVERFTKEYRNTLDGNLTLSLYKYLNGEFKKATKGNYAVAIMMSTFFTDASRITIMQENEYLSFSDCIYNNLKTILWDTDVLIRYGSQNFVGVFPFCDEENSEKVNLKMKTKFEELNSGNEKLKKYNLVNVFAVFPHEGKDIAGLLNTLAVKMKGKTDLKKNEEVS